MDGSSNQEKAQGYLKTHLEPPGSKEIKGVDLLRNPNATFGQTLVAEGNVKTPTHEFTGSFTKVNADEFISSIVDQEREKLRIELGIPENEEIPFLKTGKLAGIEIGMRMRFEENDGELYQLETLSVKRADEALNIRDLLPPGYTVVYSPLGKLERSANDVDKKLLIMNGDITSMEGLLVLLHEIGHAHDMADPKSRANLQRITFGLMARTREEIVKELEDENVQTTEDTIDLLVNAFTSDRLTDSDIRFFLEAERNAWAYALKNIKRVVNNKDTLTALESYIHDVPLLMQSDMIRSRGYANLGRE